MQDRNGDGRRKGERRQKQDEFSGPDRRQGERRSGEDRRSERREDGSSG